MQNETATKGRNRNVLRAPLVQRYSLSLKPVFSCSARSCLPRETRPSYSNTVYISPKYAKCVCALQPYIQLHRFALLLPNTTERQALNSLLVS